MFGRNCIFVIILEFGSNIGWSTTNFPAIPLSILSAVIQASRGLMMPWIPEFISTPKIARNSTTCNYYKNYYPSVNGECLRDNTWGNAGASLDAMEWWESEEEGKTENQWMPLTVWGTHDTAAIAVCSFKYFYGFYPTVQNN